jgi:hypothetical protein
MLNYVDNNGSREVLGLNITHVFFEQDNKY